jgi:hypothetical protein
MAAASINRVTRSVGSLELLVEAFSFAHRFRRNKWDFAVEISDLCAAGLTMTGLRWLLCSGFIEAAIEETQPRSKRRAFRPLLNLGFPARTCVVMTENGMQFAREVLESATPFVSPTLNGEGNGHHTDVRSNHPCWDADRRVFHLGGIVVKQFKVPAPNQETILSAFQEEGWPPRIDSPLSPRPGEDAVRRLNDSISRLNRNQRHRSIRFRSDGKGEGICWEPLSLGA